jgi:hypothetical protein
MAPELPQLPAYSRQQLLALLQAWLKGEGLNDAAQAVPSQYAAADAVRHLAKVGLRDSFGFLRRQDLEPPAS